MFFKQQHLTKSVRMTKKRLLTDFIIPNERQTAAGLLSSMIGKLAVDILKAVPDKYFTLIAV